MWTENVTSLAAERCQRIELTGDGQPVTVRDFYEALRPTKRTVAASQTS